MSKQLELYRQEDYIRAFEVLGVRDCEVRGRTLYRYMQVLHDVDLSLRQALTKVFENWARVNDVHDYPASTMAEKLEGALTTLVSPVAPPAIDELLE